MHRKFFLVGAIWFGLLTAVMGCDAVASVITPKPLTPTRITQVLTPTRSQTRQPSASPTRTRTVRAPSTTTRVIPPTLTVAPTAASAQSEWHQVAAQTVLDGVNAARRAQNLSPLTFDATLNAVARARSEDLIQRNYFSHTDPVNGDVLYENALTAAAFHFSWIGENLVEVRYSKPNSAPVTTAHPARAVAEEFVNRWLASPGHRDNILSANFKRTGIALAISPDGTRIVATQIFSD
ncbi:MAG: CAP domain-containing protein [Chloroflexi bacterium]|nr:CAP domain-containing protein [Chloroflexota bacterium]